MNLSKSLALALGLAAAGCGGQELTSPGGDPGTTRATVGAQQASAAVTLAALGRSAMVDVTVDWGMAGNNFDVYVTDAGCLELTTLTLPECWPLMGATSASAKPERLTFAAEPGSSYKVFVVNRGSTPDTVTVSVTLR